MVDVTYYILNYVTGVSKFKYHWYVHTIYHSINAIFQNRFMKKKQTHVTFLVPYLISMLFLKFDFFETFQSNLLHTTQTTVDIWKVLISR